MSSTIAAIQMNSSDVVEENLSSLSKAMESAVSHGADLVLLPENVLCNGASTADIQRLAEPLGTGFMQQQLRHLAQSLRLSMVVGSLPIQSGGQKPFATSLLIASTGEIKGHYHKRHLFDVQVGGEHYRESECYQAGNTPVMLQLDKLSLGMSVCYDLRFPLHYQQLRAKGANVLLVPSAFTHTTGEAHWEVLLRARAIETQSYVVAANQVGTHQNNRASYGHSMIVDPWGRVCEKLTTEEGVIHHELDLQYLSNLRESFSMNGDS